MHQFTYNTATLAGVMNQAKDLLLAELERQQLLKGSANKLSEEWSFIIVEKGWLGSILDKMLFKADAKDPMPVIKLVKILSHAEPEYKLKNRPVSHLKEIKTDPFSKEDK